MSWEELALRAAIYAIYGSLVGVLTLAVPGLWHRWCYWLDDVARERVDMQLQARIRATYPPARPMAYECTKCGKVSNSENCPRCSRPPRPVLRVGRIGPPRWALHSNAPDPAGPTARPVDAPPASGEWIWK